MCHLSSECLKVAEYELAEMCRFQRADGLAAGQAMSQY